MLNCKGNNLIFSVHFPSVIHLLPQRLVFEDLHSKPDFTTQLRTMEDVTQVILIYLFIVVTLIAEEH